MHIDLPLRALLIICQTLHRLIPSHASAPPECLHAAAIVPYAFCGSSLHHAHPRPEGCAHSHLCLVHVQISNMYDQRAAQKLARANEQEKQKLQQQQEARQRQQQQKQANMRVSLGHMTDIWANSLVLTPFF